MAVPPSAEPETCQPRLLDVLRCLSVSGVDALAGALDNMAISSARLACKALRELLDGSIEGVRLRMRKDELIEVTHGSPGASFADLARWPRASSVTLALEDGTDQGTDELCEPGCCAADVAMLWLSRQSSAARHTILDVELEYAPMLEHPWQVAALSTLPLWLPNLKVRARARARKRKDKCSPVTGKGAEPLHSLRPNNLIART